MLTLPSFGCSSQVSPEWHGWLHYMHDKTGAQLAAELEKPFKQAHTINQTMLRPEFSREGLDPPQPPEFHQPPGTYAARVARGRVGAKYEQWSGQPSTANPELRNCERKDALQPTAFAPGRFPCDRPCLPPRPLTTSRSARCVWQTRTTAARCTFRDEHAKRSLCCATSPWICVRGPRSRRTVRHARPVGHTLDSRSRGYSRCRVCVHPGECGAGDI